MEIDDQTLDDLLREFWIRRADESTVIEGSKDVLEFLRGKGFVTVIITGNDG